MWRAFLKYSHPIFISSLLLCPYLQRKSSSFEPPLTNARAYLGQDHCKSRQRTPRQWTYIGIIEPNMCPDKKISSWLEFSVIIRPQILKWAFCWKFGPTWAQWLSLWTFSSTSVLNLLSVTLKAYFLQSGVKKTNKIRAGFGGNNCYPFTPALLISQIS